MDYELEALKWALNLAESSQEQQLGSADARCRASAYRGVKIGPKGKWAAVIQEVIPGDAGRKKAVNNHWLGNYETPEEAARVYDTAARGRAAARGEKADTNFELCPTCGAEIRGAAAKAKANAKSARGLPKMRNHRCPPPIGSCPVPIRGWQVFEQRPTSSSGSTTSDLPENGAPMQTLAHPFLGTDSGNAAMPEPDLELRLGF